MNQNVVECLNEVHLHVGLFHAIRWSFWSTRRQQRWAGIILEKQLPNIQTESYRWVPTRKHALEKIQVDLFLWLSTFILYYFYWLVAWMIGNGRPIYMYWTNHCSEPSISSTNNKWTHLYRCEEDKLSPLQVWGRQTFAFTCARQTI